jgi:hypothetical protein
MSARDHESDCGKGWHLSLIRIAQPCGAQMTLQVIDWEHRETARPGPRASNASPYKQRSNETRTSRQRDSFDLARNPEPLSLLKHLVEEPWQPLMVGASRHLWNHTTERRMDRGLARHAFSKHLSAAAHKGNSALITARFNR